MNDLEILKLFNARAERIRRLNRFLESLNSERGIDIRFSADGTEVTELGPDEESMSAAILTLRMFIQNNDSISFNNMAGLYSRINVPQDLKDQFDVLRSSLNEYLDRYSQLLIGNNEMLFGRSSATITQSDSGQLTNRELMEIYVYGDYAHSNQRRREVFEKIAREPLFAPIGNLVFTNIIKSLVMFINCAAELNQLAIEHLRSEI